MRRIVKKQSVNANSSNHYEGLSLIEMVITLLIVSMVLIVTSATLAALIRASAIASAKTMSRSESEFLLELLEKSIMNSQSELIVLYKSNRQLTSDGFITSDPTIERIQFNGNRMANEIHYRPVRSSDWVCLALVKGGSGTGSEGQGYIVKGYSSTQTENCLESGQVIILNSDEIDVLVFDIYGYTTSLGNYSFVIDLTVRPIYWIPGRQSVIRPEYARQLVVSTRRLIY